MKELILEMEHYASTNNVPIIELDSIKFIMKYIKLNKVSSILEIGTAIGYSAILMANANSFCEITTIEKDEKRFYIDRIISRGTDYRGFSPMALSQYQVALAEAKYTQAVN